MSMRPALCSAVVIALLAGTGAHAETGVPTKLPSAPKWAAKSEFVETDLNGANGTAAAPEAPAAALDAAPVASTETVPAVTAPVVPESKSFISDGQAFAMEELGFKISPIAGWEVNTYTGNLSFVMKEPEDKNPAYDKAKYRRNVTVAVLQKASPIDERRATELEAQLVKQFGEDGSVANYQIIEHKFFNYRGENDGLLVYGAYELGEYRMMQMNVLVSGGEKQFLTTYTDMADRFSDQTDPMFGLAWSSMVSIEVAGATPTRTNELIRYGSLASGALLLLLTALLLRRRASKRDYSSFADHDDDGIDGAATGSMMATLAGSWKLNRKGEVSGNDGLIFSSHAGTKIPTTKSTEYVSGY